MKAYLLALLVTTYFALPALAQTPWTPASMIHYKRISSPVISNDGQLVAYVVATPRIEGDQSDFLAHIYIVSTDGKLNHQVTFGDKSCTNPRFSPDGHYLSFTSGRGRNGKNQLYLMRLSGGETWPITTQKGNVGAYRWSPNGRCIAFVMIEPITITEERDHRERKDWSVVDDPRNAHLYTVSLTLDKKGQYPVKRLTRGGFHVASFDWSPR